MTEMDGFELKNYSRATKILFKEKADFMIEEYKRVQGIARDVIDHLIGFIAPGITEKEIVIEAEKELRIRGINSFWYWGIGAFVFLGERTILSMSGREYTPNNEVVKDNDIITVDLSPQIGSIWGDYARTFIVRDSKVIGINTTDFDSYIQKGCELCEGIAVEEHLHGRFVDIVKHDITFEEVFEIMNREIESLGYRNLDFLKNLGHTVEKAKEDRVYIEKGNNKPIRSHSLITFEPHIGRKNGKVGFKREDIYFISEKGIERI